MKCIESKKKIWMFVHSTILLGYISVSDSELIRKRKVIVDLYSTVYETKENLTLTMNKQSSKDT